MAHPKGLALAESKEAYKQWTAFQLRKQHEDAMVEWFKNEKKSRRKKKQEGAKATSKEPQGRVSMPQPTKREAKVRVAAAAPKLSPVVVEHSVTKFTTGEVNPSSRVSAATESGSAMSIQFPPLSFDLEASKGRARDVESSVMLKLRKEMEQLKVSE